MKSFTLVAVMAVGVFAQSPTENSIFDATTMMDAEATIFAEDNAAVEDMAAVTEMSSTITNEDLVKSLDWIQDLYNTFCVTKEDGGMLEEDGGMRFLQADTMGTTEAAPQTPSEKDVQKMIEQGMSPEEIANAMVSGDVDSLIGETLSKVGDDWNIDMDAIDLDRLKDVHNKICNAIKTVHSEGTSYNMADETEKKEITSMWGEELTKVVQDLFEGAVSAYAVTGTAALAAGLVALAF